MAPSHAAPTEMQSSGRPRSAQFIHHAPHIRLPSLAPRLPPLARCTPPHFVPHTRVCPSPAACGGERIHGTAACCTACSSAVAACPPSAPSASQPNCPPSLARRTLCRTSPETQDGSCHLARTHFQLHAAVAGLVRFYGTIHGTILLLLSQDSFPRGKSFYGQRPRALAIWPRTSRRKLRAPIA